MKQNMNQIAKEISEIEGKKVEVNIAQIKEVLRSLASLCSDMDILSVFVNYVAKLKAEE